MRQKVVRQQHRLRPLQVRVAREIGVFGLPGSSQQYPLQLNYPPADGGQFPLGPQAQVRGDLVVAAAARVQTGPDLARDLGYPALHCGVDVFVARPEHEGACAELLLHALEGGQQDLGVRVRQQPAPGQATHVRP